MTNIEMTSSKPYLIRALYEWISDNGLTPQIAVDATQDGVRVPREYVKEGQIVLNIAARAVGHFSWDNETIAFSARFAGASQKISVPVEAVLSIYARENGAGMVFGAIELEESEDESEQDEISLESVPQSASQDDESGEDQPPQPPQPSRPAGRPTLKVIK